ncbi:pentatricopeptide repeat-containing protein At1g80880, mitochondrial isoform X1 [Rosa chinensis]|uniref:pentatricopeptide repeat-containing protein At1g80880, mitochondrial isoform X1 n=1 Tax=Rosa chinensis TaxID=74649 RepID=UPI001AD8F945|nr:pentatricopeptide repeat-containing protein At1g80880, mitochondrial isoform X1 [Rosa chinensis]
MALPSIARRLRTKHPLCLSLTLLHHHHHHPITNSPYSSLSLHPRLSQPFHPTSIVPSQTPRHFSTLRPFSAEIPHHPLGFNGQRFNTDHSHNLGLTQFLELLTSTAGLASEADAVAFLDESGVEPKRDTVFQAIWELRGDWKLAFLGFKWGEKWGCCDEEACSLMVWVFGSHRKFSTAWCLIRDLNQALIDTRRAMLIMIDRYASANHPRKAIKTFQIMEKFRLSPDQEAFHILLNALCKNGNMEEAEEFMLVSKKFFPLEVEGFNIVLNGWCNISVDVYQAKRVWREMSKYCITPDATSYTHMISCFSKVGNLFDSLRLYDEMKKRDWVPGLKVYNSLIYVLTRENCFKEALKVLDKVKEIGLQPDATTYNSMIGPLCESKKIEEAQQMLSSMINDNLSPTIETYHAFLQSPGSKATVEVLNRMKKANLGPNGNTFLMILEKFFILEQPGKALEIWNEMKNYGVVPDSTHYTSMVQGLATCGLLAKAKELLAEMTSNGIPEDPKLKKLLKKPIGGSVKGKRRVRQVNQAKRINLKQDRVVRSRSPRQSRKKKTSSE